MHTGMKEPGDADWRDREKNATKAKAAKPLSELRISRSANGAHMVEHHFLNSGGGGPYKEPETHAFTDGNKMLAHVAKHMGVKVAPPRDSMSEGTDEA